MPAHQWDLLLVQRQFCARSVDDSLPFRCGYNYTRAGDIGVSNSEPLPRIDLHIAQHYAGNR